VTRAVLLDFGGTLDSDGLHWSTQFADAFAAAGLEVERSVLDRAFLAADRALSGQPDIADLDLEAHVGRQARLMLEQLGAFGDPGSAEAVRAAFISRTRTCLARARELLTRHQKRCRFGLVSNFTPNLHRIVRDAGLAELVPVVACSETEGVGKPDPRLFELALSRLGVPPGRAAMIGDSLASDIAPAKGLGLRTCWIRGDRVFVPADEGAADHQVGSLAGAFEALQEEGFFDEGRDHRRG
jgi:putative hydrolase of the HAD superfamily